MAAIKSAKFTVGLLLPSSMKCCEQAIVARLIPYGCCAIRDPPLALQDPAFRYAIITSLLRNIRHQVYIKWVSTASQL